MAAVPPKPTPPGLWRRTPPAIFPPTLGLVALALGWRKAGQAFDLPAAIGEALSGAVTLLCAFVFLTYLVKVLRRPAVVLEDLRILPGRAGLAAAMLMLYLMAAAIGPYLPAAALAVLATGAGLHVMLTVAMLYVFATGPAEQRRVNPTWHLLFSGWIVAALVATQLGLTMIAVGLFWVALVFAVAIWVVSLQQFSRETVPAPLRPLLAIHLAPVAVIGTTASVLGAVAMSYVFAMSAALLLFFFLVRLRWLLAAGFSPLWGALTFPLVATASLWLTMGEELLVPGGIALIAATLIVPPIAVRIYKMWAKGELALKTGAAIA
ncbi:tellurium resistance protein [Rhodobacter capsulatus]|uniref:SLAC1 family transporter n=1 Tax=Rhodobacter capsulatus TaxID=1061 RepID=UPI00402543A3